jgi:tRNA dimethylallyltransferase
MIVPKILVVVGPTACGKSALGIALAKRFDGEVIAADSRTVYRGMDIGTAKPPADSAVSAPYGDRNPYVREGQERVLPSIDTLFAEKPRLVEGIPHWGFDLVDPDEPFSVSTFQAYADAKIVDICRRGKLPIVVGGTGLYIRAILDRPNFAGATPSPELRLEVEKMTDNELLEEIAARDPDTAATIDDRNRRRLLRAVEILRTIGGTLAEHQAFGDSMYDVLQIGISLDREVLYARIDQRVDEMIGKGLIDEARALMTKYGAESQAMTGIGYRQIADFFAGKEKLREAVLRIKYDSHHYARRQETWFRRDSRIMWVSRIDEAVKIADTFLKR